MSGNIFGEVVVPFRSVFSFNRYVLLLAKRAINSRCPSHER
jgi:hypothetical protein